MIAIIGHLERAKVKKLAGKLLKLLEKKGLEAELLDIGSRKLKAENYWLVCVVGGDGSLLRVARQLRNVPLVGIAAGSRSYLMQVKPGKIKKAIGQLAAGKFAVEERARLQGFLNGKKLPLALNELLVVPKKSGMLINCMVKVGAREKRIACDGLIVATPMGSSGHAYSAGGKKLGIGSGKIIVVPSNSLNRQWKPFVVSAVAGIEIRCLDKERAAEVVVDGRERFAMKGRLRIERGENALVLKVKGLP